MITRRSFLAGLLATTALLPVARAFVPPAGAAAGMIPFTFNTDTIYFIQAPPKGSSITLMRAVGDPITGTRVEVAR